MRRNEPPLVLAVDIGTSALKAGLCREDGTFAATASVAFRPIRTAPGGRAEADAAEWLSGLHDACRELAQSGDLDRVRAMVVSGQGPSVVAVDREGRPLAPAVLWLDGRAAAEAEEISRLWGRPVEPWYFLPKALWLARNSPGVNERAAYFMSCPELLALHLAGEARTALPSESFRGYFWDEAILGGLGLDPSRFPGFVPPGEVVGSLLSGPAALLGLQAAIPVLLGGPDYLMSLLGTATVAPGRACDRAGSSEGINLCASRELRHPRLTCHPHIVRPLWNIAGMIPASGLAVSWVRSIFGADDEPFEAFFDALDSVPPGAGGLVFVPFSSTGGGGAFAGLGLRHGRREIARAVVDAVALEIRDVVEAMRGGGLPVSSLTVTGGQARLDSWNRIKADATGAEVRVPKVADAELVGGAAVGFVSLGAYSSLAEAAERMVSIDRVFRPDPRAVTLYGELASRRWPPAGSPGHGLPR